MEMSGRPKYKILIVEDDADLSKALGMMLNFDGHQVHIVDRGDAALAMLATSKFDLLITDYLMPEMNGDQLAALVKHRWPDQPIILATEAVETMTPRSPSAKGSSGCMAAATSRIMLKVPIRLTRMTRS